MKILYVTPVNPSKDNGGGRHCLANLRSLLSLKDVQVDYVGPPVSFTDFGGDELAHLGIVYARPFNWKSKFSAMIHFSATSLLPLFNEFSAKHPLDSYDLLFVESSRCGFVFKHLGNNIPSILSMHNVEIDYMRHNCRGIRRITYHMIGRSEAASLNNCGCVLVLHNEDSERIVEIYGNIIGKKKVLHPVCSFASTISLPPINERPRNIVFVGSLDLPYNIDGLISFMEKAWPTLRNSLRDLGYRFLVAGRNPSPELMALLSKEDVEILPNPQNMETIFAQARLMILPDLNGSGMKLRVAEAMSYGVPVVGTAAGLYGYDSIKRYGKKVTRVEDMADGILSILVNEDFLSELSIAAISEWNLRYSFETFQARLTYVVKNNTIASSKAHGYTTSD